MGLGQVSLIGVRDLRLGSFFNVSDSRTVLHEQKFKDLLNSTFQVSVERRVLGLESEVYERPGFYLHCG